MPVILVTGFGSFPGAPVNPTVALLDRIDRVRRPALADVRIATHVFATRYAIVDPGLPALIAREAPDAIVLFGVATRAKRLRLELIARNRASVLFPDAGGAKPVTAAIAHGGRSWLTGRFSPHRLLAAARSTGIHPALSRNAGAYLCNYAYWRALEAAARPNGPRIVAFVHIPPLRTKARPRRAKPQRPQRAERPGSRRAERVLTLVRLAHASEAMLIALRAMLRDTAALAYR